MNNLPPLMNEIKTNSSLGSTRNQAVITKQTFQLQLGNAVRGGNQYSMRKRANKSVNY